MNRPSSRGRLPRRRIALPRIALGLLIGCLSVVPGCAPTFRDVDPIELEQAWLDSKNHSAVSWWYLGEQGGFEHFVRKTPLKREGYRIPASQVELTVERRPLGFRRSHWVNLKAGQLGFPGSSAAQPGPGAG